MGILDIFKKSADRYALYNSTGRTVTYKHDKDRYLTLLEKSLYINRAIDKRSEKVGETQFLLKRGETILTDHHFVNLLDKPNSTLTGDQFFKLANKYKDATGECWIEKVGVFADKPTSLELLIPSRVTKNCNAERSAIESITYTPLNGKARTIAFEDVIYWYNPLPKEPLEGESILMSGIRSIESDITLLEYQHRIAVNGGKLDGVFRFKDNNLNRAQMKELKESFKESLADSKETDNIMFVGGGAEYQNVGLSPQELGYLDTRKMLADDMARLTGVPNAILGVTSGETFANSDAAIRIFLRETIKPVVSDLVNVLNWHLIPDEFELDFVDPTPEDVENKIKLATAGETTNTLTINERRELLGYEPVPGGDDIMVTFNKLPLGQEPAQPAEEKQVKKKITHPLQNTAARRAYNQNYKKQLDANGKRLEQVLVTYFNGQEERLKQNLTGRKKFKTKGLLDEVFNKPLEIDLAKMSVLPVIREIVKNAGQEVMEMFNDREYNVTSQMETVIDKQTSLMAERITDTTADQLAKQFQESFAADESLSQLTERVSETFGGIKETRAKLIANTESHIFMQTAKQDGYERVGLPIKIWTWSPGIQGGVRDSHAAMDGEEVPLNSFFSNGMKYPGDPAFGADQNANCQCSI